MHRMQPGLMRFRSRPGLLPGNIIWISDRTLTEVKRLGKLPPPLVELSPTRTFARFGAADWTPVVPRSAMDSKPPLRRRGPK
jgi:hypothetical protein